MDNAWQPQDNDPSNSADGISIPTRDVGPADYSNGNGAPPRSSRSRSPGDRGRSGGEGGGDGDNPGNNLHVSGLSSKTDSRDLEAAFAKIGRVSKASVVYDPHTRESRLFGFVTMETAEEADAAITALNATELMGKIMTVVRVSSALYARDYDDRRGSRSSRYDDRGSSRRDYRDDRDRDRDRYRDRDYERYDRDYDRYDRDRYDRGSRYDDRDRDRRY
ncbi:RNA-binding domain-containing protein [Lentinula edodes]|nr:RNA-binding domain-containing protein [Lentinula edodes]